MLSQRLSNVFDGTVSLFRISIVFLAISASALAQQQNDGESADSQGDSNPVATLDTASAKAEAERWLPPNALAYVQIAPARIWLDHPLRLAIAESEPFTKIWNSPDVLNARTGLLAAEWATGMKLETFLERISAGGMYAAVDSEMRGIVILARTRDEKWLQRTLNKLVEFARNNQSKNREERQADGTVKSAKYRGIQGYQINGAVFAFVGPWFVMSNRSELAKEVLDRHLDGSESTLADAPWRVSPTHGPRMIPPDVSDAGQKMPIATAEIDLNRIRELFPTSDLYRTKAKDFGAELLLGGILALVQHAPSAAIELSMEPEALAAEASFPTRMEWFEGAREHYVGPQGRGKSLPVLEVDGALASLSTYRNLSELWLRAGDLFDQQVNDQLAQADNTLTTLFSGKDFGTDILGAVDPELRMVVVPQTWQPDQRQPSVKLPAFALVARLKQPDVMRQELKRIFQSFIGFLNVTGAMEGNPQLDLMSEVYENGPMYWADYVIDADRSYENGLPIQYNFAPAIAFVGDHVILSSHCDLARKWVQGKELLDASSDPTTPTHTELVVHGPMMHQMLAANRDSLIAQNMLEKGHSRLQAIKEVDQLLHLVEWIDRVELALSFDTRSSIRLRVNYR
jgi:hypothetical protein